MKRFIDLVGEYSRNIEGSYQQIASITREHFNQRLEGTEFDPRGRVENFYRNSPYFSARIAAGRALGLEEEIDNALPGWIGQLVADELRGSKGQRAKAYADHGKLYQTTRNHPYQSHLVEQRDPGHRALALSLLCGQALNETELRMVYEESCISRASFLAGRKLGVNPVPNFFHSYQAEIAIAALPVAFTLYWLSTIV
ncbi:hypothetical protein J4460_02510 [Candidatus Woesearchaeota archaeon]|nr:MAG: hypothetical protein QS99_C0005G0002 [archaeon GW2011_AR4]MBS3129522.1 hypothetical protein [Candidatus Woesearchaeota archaeon]HIH37490.1 hypothetical protein [Candidatus Woesearchaeota archaeon]HIH49591.1 hypothetical protein [Candidatus Woesearchaeota archaeon]HIJ03255.1 hypothetical protein [Candidatus Woesearchaeota archaeon]